MRAAFATAILGGALGLTGCANINSIGRTTILPATEGSESLAPGKAVHLDAQQRVLVVNGLGEFCAEPSPDALAAYAASLGVGVSAPGTGAGSLAGGQQSSAASIGLRTQSITLMRDALFRMCEAYANGAVGPAQVATLLGRSQDLTAVILAVEQLTGAVAANQVALTGTTSASASASLLANQSMLDSARVDETRKQAQLDEAKADRDKKAATRTRVNADANATPEQKQTAQQELDAAENLVKTRQILLDDARRNRETIENNKDSALTAAAAGTTGSSQFSTPVARKELSKEATEAVAVAVHGMVTEVLRKEYTEEACMAMLTYIPRDWKDWPGDQKATLARVQDLCAQMILGGIQQRIEKANFGSDNVTADLNAWLARDSANRPALAQWLKDRNLNISVTLLLLGKEYAGLRRQAATDLKVPAATP